MWKAVRAPRLNLERIARWCAGLLPVALMAVVLVIVVAPIQAQVDELRAQWNIDGPPCARTTAALDPAVHLRTEFTYVGVDYAYERAGASCADIPDRTLLRAVTHQACQFNNPRFIRVRTPAETVTFDIPPVEHATTFVRGGHVSCVLAGWFGGAVSVAPGR